MNNEYNWKNIWIKIRIYCPWCGANQESREVTNKCFYCSGLFFIGIDGKVEKINSK